MNKKNIIKASVAIGFILCLVLVSLLIFPVASAEEDATTIRGMVKYDDDQPIESGEVTLVNIHTGETTTVEISKGEVYQFDVEPGYYQVIAKGEFCLDTGDGVSDIFIAEKGKVTRVTPDLRLKRVPHDTTVTGFVLDNMGKGVANATVTAYSTDPEYLGYEIQTMTDFNGNDTGKFSIELYNGNFDLYGTEVDFEYTILPIIVNATATEFNLTLVTGPTPTTISGYAMDIDTLDYLEGVRAWAYDINNDRYIESEYSGGSYFEIKAYDGIFNLIVDVPGYLTFINSSIVIDTNTPGKEYVLVNAEMTKDLPEDIDTTILVGDDFQSITVTTKWVITSGSEIYGLDPLDMGSPRMQIDNVLGDGNGAVSNSEANAFKDWFKNAGPYYLHTDTFFNINDTAFGPGNTVQYSIIDFVGFEGAVDSKAQMYIRTRMVYELQKDIDVEDPWWEAETNQYTVDVLAMRDNEEIVLQINDSWEILDTTRDEWNMEDITEVPAALRIYKREAPEAEIEVINEEALYKESDENGTLIKYIVKAEQNITLRSVSSDSVGTIVNTTWLPGEGLAPIYDDEATFNYQNEGMKPVKLKVTDSSGLTSEATIDFYVDIRAPVITFKIYNKTDVDITDNSPIEVDEETKLTFDANDTVDDVFDTEDLTFVWTFGDDSAPVHGNKTTHTFGKPGEYNVTLEVSDPLGLTDNKTVSGIIVIDTTEPWPVISANNSVDMGEQFELNASQSYDEDFPEETKYDQIKLYEWDFDYTDDVEDEDNFTAERTGKIVNWTYFNPGTYTVMLRVTDMSGNVGEVTKLIQVNGPDMFIAMQPKVKPSKDIKEGDDVTFTINVSNQGLIPAENVVVRIYHTEVDNKNLIGEYTIPKLGVQEAQNITIKWEAERPNDKDKVKLLFVVDPDGQIGEINEHNNNWTMEIKVEDDMTVIIVVGIIGGIIVVLIVAYIVYRKFFGPDEDDEDRSERRKKAGKRRGGDDDDDDDEDEGIGGKIGGMFKKGGKKDKDDDDDEDDD